MMARQLVAAAALLLVTASASAHDSYDPNRDPEKDLRAAREQAASSGRRILVVVGGQWCGWCRRLDRFKKETAEVAALWERHFVTLHVNFSQENENTAFLKRFPRIEGYPHIFILDKDGRLLHSQETGTLEQGKGYSVEKVTAFLRAWRS